MSKRFKRTYLKLSGAALVAVAKQPALSQEMEQNVPLSVVGSGGMTRRSSIATEGTTLNAEAAQAAASQLVQKQNVF